MQFSKTHSNPFVFCCCCCFRDLRQRPLLKPHRRQAGNRYRRLHCWNLSWIGHHHTNQQLSASSRVPRFVDVDFCSYCCHSWQTQCKPWPLLLLWPVQEIYCGAMERLLGLITESIWMKYSLKNKKKSYQIVPTLVLQWWMCFRLLFLDPSRLHTWVYLRFKRMATRRLDERWYFRSWCPAWQATILLWILSGRISVRWMTW